MLKKNVIRALFCKKVIFRLLLILINKNKGVINDKL